MGELRKFVSISVEIVSLDTNRAGSGYADRRQIVDGDIVGTLGQTSATEHLDSLRGRVVCRIDIPKAITR